MQKRYIFIIVGGLLLLAVFVLLGSLLSPRAKYTLSAQATLYSDESGELPARTFQASFADPSDPPLLITDIDLADYAGQLIKLNFSGAVYVYDTESANTENIFLGCSAELVSPQGAQTIDFFGWQKPPSAKCHPQTLGSPAVSVSRPDGSRFFYNTGNTLWHVLRPPAQAKLRLRFTALQIDSASAAVSFAPAAPHATLPFVTTPQPTDNHPPDIFIYLIDTLRADHLGCYGYSRPTTPNIDSFAAQAILFEQAQTPATWTRPAVASLLTGLYPSTHGAIFRESDTLADWPLLLSEALQNAGYQTGAVVTNMNVDTPFGFNQGFDHFICENLAPASWINRQSESFINSCDPDSPIFLFLHTMEPHVPYTPSPQSRRLFDRGFSSDLHGTVEEFRKLGSFYPDLSSADLQHLIDLYDAEICDNDQSFGQFLQLLKKTNRFDNALIVFLSDHGDSFMEHDTLHHGHTLNSQEMRVPLLLRFPGGQYAGRRFSQQVNLVDLFPTIITQAQISFRLDYSLPGLNLAQLADTPPAASRPAFSEVSLFEDNRLNLVAAIDEDGFKRVIDVSKNPGEIATKKSIGLWDTNTDPEELHDLSQSLPVRAAYSEQLIAQWLTAQLARSPQLTESQSIELTEQQRNQLRALGYLK